MTIFRLISFVSGSSITLSSTTALFGAVACTYRAIPIEEDQSRLVVKLLLPAPPWPARLDHKSGPPGRRLAHDAQAAADTQGMC